MRGVRLGSLSLHPVSYTHLDVYKRQIPTPLALIAELTHRCPLHCVYCSNPLELQSRGLELSTEVWSRVLREAAEAGVLQVDFTGGEPLARPDLVELVRAARAAGLYINLITSGLPLDERRLTDLVNACLLYTSLGRLSSMVSPERLARPAHADPRYP